VFCTVNHEFKYPPVLTVLLDDTLQSAFTFGQSASWIPYEDQSKTVTA